MARKTNNSAVALAIQSVVGTFESGISDADLLPVSQLRPQINGVTISNDEYTGSIVNNADVVAGKRLSFAFNVKIRPPGGTAIPDENDFLLGRLFQSMKMTEVRNTSAIPVSPEALGSGSDTNNAVLGASAAATAGLYKAWPLILSDNDTGFKNQLTMIRSYAADKTAQLMEVLSSAPAANYQIPPFIGYMRSVTSDDPIILSMKFWLDGVRYDLRDCRPTSAQITFPTSTREQARFPELQVTYEGILDDYADEATPVIPALGAIPLFRDGDLWLDNKRVGGSDLTIDLGLQSENPPNPNQQDGSDAPEVTASTASISMTRQSYTKAVFDSMALADAQQRHPLWGQYGSGPGAMVQFAAPDVRFNYASPDLGGGLINESGDLLVDAIDRGIAIVFPGVVA
ncbi:hypothetical protein GRI39_01965 [Altererythrobacter indicus]|uniref:Uncharacterized protein n=1 Tax=Altericroceibacterium indicum TaxID=374177 RepID=A0A845A3I6_9SPHN|nr:hypothetical protein [Altericroceibacterium indicum]MXP24812.1 hypothetical protein [Altericroceibacterium indicum]